MQGRAYVAAIRRLTDRFEDRELDHLADLARRVAEAVMAGSAIHFYDNGHMLNHELFNRAGGLPLLTRFGIAGPQISDETPRRAAGAPEKPSTEDEAFPLALARHAVRMSDLRPGDYLLIGSVSGRSPFIVELALAAGAGGVRTVALTALAYARTLPPLHPSGQLLHQVTDETVDIQTEAGDAALAVPGIRERVGPTSGIMAALTMWALEAEIAEALVQEHQVEPTVLRSVNYPDGPERLAEARTRFSEQGY